jgi:hypothetical protein
LHGLINECYEFLDKLVENGLDDGGDDYDDDDDGDNQ